MSTVTVSDNGQVVIPAQVATNYLSVDDQRFCRRPPA